MILLEKIYWTTPLEEQPSRDFRKDHRSSHPEVFFKKAVRKNYERFIKSWKIPMQEPLFYIVAGWRLWKEDVAQLFFFEFFVIFKNIDIVEHLQIAASKIKKQFWKISLKELVFWYSLGSGMKGTFFQICLVGYLQIRACLTFSRWYWGLVQKQSPKVFCKTRCS